MKTIGNIFQLEGFFSTSTYNKEADRFGHHRFILTVPGRNAIDKNTAGYADISDCSYFFGENEVLFNPGNHFKVTNYREDEKIVEIEAELIFVDELLSKEEFSESEKCL